MCDSLAFCRVVASSNAIIAHIHLLLPRLPLQLIENPAGDYVNFGGMESDRIYIRNQLVLTEIPCLSERAAKADRTWV